MPFPCPSRPLPPKCAALYDAPAADAIPPSLPPLPPSHACCTSHAPSLPISTLLSLLPFCSPFLSHPRFCLPFPPQLTLSLALCFHFCLLLSHSATLVLFPVTGYPVGGGGGGGGGGVGVGVKSC